MLHLCVVVYVPVHVFMGIPGRGGPCPIVLLNPAETGSPFPAAVHHRPRPSYVTASRTKIHTTTASLNDPTCSRPSVYLFLFILILEMLSTAHVLFFKASQAFPHRQTDLSGHVPAYHRGFITVKRLPQGCNFIHRPATNFRILFVGWISEATWGYKERTIIVNIKLLFSSPLISFNEKLMLVD